ncbi:hypothetical protein HYE68_008913 [Fusarium pseudograminearum]|nr:hypothetical protein HYE68_008913 [Fusarium pseudograminearum]
MSTEQTADEIITLLGLTPHPEGGYFFKSFHDPQSHIDRAHSTCIYYLVIGNGGPTRWHRINDACEVWHHYAGAPLKLSVAWDDETGVTSKIVGKELARGQRPQAVVERAQWQRAESLGEWTGSFVTAVIVLCLVRLPSPGPCRFGHVVKPSEIMGLILILSGLFCAVLFLQWGGTTHAWNSWQIILLMVIFVITIVAFGGLQTWQGEEATIPPRIAKQRTMLSVCVFTLFSSGAYYLLIYFLPLYFQEVKGATALRSGIQCIPLILCNVVGSLSSGLLTTKLGHYFPSLYLSMVLTCIGAGLFVTLRPGTETAPVVGYQVLYGFGSGLGFQLPQIAAQTVLKETEVQIGIAMTLFFQSLGGTLFLSVGNSVFKEQLRNRLLEHAGLSAQQLKVILSAGAVAIESTLQPKELEAVRSGYSEALIYAYYTALAASILSAFGGLFVEWKSVTEKVPSSS